jgi:hypothetical protein
VSYESSLNQTVTYWPVTGHDVYGGNTFGSPETRPARWEDRADTIRDKSGVEYVTKSRVFMSQDFDLDGYLYLGTSAAANPTTVSGAYEIRQKSAIPDLSALQTLYTAFL